MFKLYQSPTITETLADRGLIESLDTSWMKCQSQVIHPMRICHCERRRGREIAGGKIYHQDEWRPICDKSAGLFAIIVSTLSCGWWCEMVPINRIRLPRSRWMLIHQQQQRRVNITLSVESRSGVLILSSSIDIGSSQNVLVMN